MKKFAVTLLLVAGCVQSIWAQFRISTVLIEPTLGVGISTLPKKMLSPPLAWMGSITVETSRGGSFAVEGGGVGFRDVAFPKKMDSYFGSYYIRRGHFFYGARIGKTFMLNNAKQRIALTLGLNSLQVVEPIRLRSGILATGVEEKTKFYVNVPFLAEYHLLRKQNPSKRLVVTARWNFNAYHSFPILGVGYKVAVFRNHKI